jgi:type IV pilus assembly protein PilB
MADFGEFLLKKKIVGPEQIAEAKAMSQKNGHKFADALIKLGYASSEQIIKALALMENYEYIDLKDVPIPRMYRFHRRSSNSYPNRWPAKTR